MLKSTRTGRAPALRAASSSEESARESAAWQVRNAIGSRRVASTTAMPGILSIGSVGRWSRSLTIAVR